MSEKQANGPLAICGVDWGGTSWSAAQVRNSDGEVLAVFRGPDCEANARLFLRAQHMDELVEAAKALRLAVYKVESQVQDTGEYDEHAALALFTANEAIAPILSKIEGGGEGKTKPELKALWQAILDTPTGDPNGIHWREDDTELWCGPIMFGRLWDMNTIHGCRIGWARAGHAVTFEVSETKARAALEAAAREQIKTWQPSNK